ncbi:hypothetical protein A3K34_00110 [candidate division WWE3 bacterium RIFOXYC1_FULL_40_10]|uniref:Uncharacterized protein n=1 Tax=candidate division WWE3 bacterium RIFOXYA2_FULL_46_9 TaxID=1802636 RepID=A0A1F4W1B2_UNCKA|nr:MAG: hypothetical protein A3K58_00110 [candidate division WWE3 bacterium RIFOXYB1_FULL_40_22]OGC61297.1 MAG: hypothetical protein A3K37_00110 [candidate division WWE3 bacterium RIFOXYA1_FULL_40_11]OGC63207.1 MAG: hypothetical protein A2264_00765 [candidate division WWE3 bacterium RIFOXYA2_FULL_46_9]OGC65288.1 MAG: hypothetical protein A2326_04395 [candidate division WWE3 bacterium RIFOXYB2_FULL_41_6]OGC65680.1 MAG: hypothetical protein A3K34_00110 [candidate division WWE3 bacterium RIFOXYC1_
MRTYGKFVIWFGLCLLVNLISMGSGVNLKQATPVISSFLAFPCLLFSLLLFSPMAWNYTTKPILGKFEICVRPNLRSGDLWLGTLMFVSANLASAYGIWHLFLFI